MVLCEDEGYSYGEGSAMKLVTMKAMTWNRVTLKEVTTKIAAVKAVT